MTPIVDEMTNLSHPKVLASMTHAINDHSLVLSPRSAEVDQAEWLAHLAEKEQRIRQEAEKEKSMYKSILQLDEMHEAYEKLVKQAEERLVKIYEKAGEVEENLEQIEETNPEVVGILEEAQGKRLERVDLCGRKLRFLPEAFGKISGLLSLNLSGNQLESLLVPVTRFWMKHDDFSFTFNLLLFQLFEFFLTFNASFRKIIAKNLNILSGYLGAAAPRDPILDEEG